MSNFDQFASVVGKTPWDMPHGDDKIHRKILKNSFLSMLTLTE